MTTSMAGMFQTGDSVSIDNKGVGIISGNEGGDMYAIVIDGAEDMYCSVHGSRLKILNTLSATSKAKKTTDIPDEPELAQRFKKVTDNDVDDLLAQQNRNTARKTLRDITMLSNYLKSICIR